MIRVGIVDPDTSHGEMYPPLVNRESDLRVTAVFDGGSVRKPGWVDEYAPKFGLERVCSTLEELVDAVDVGMVMGQNWDLHVVRARPFLEAGKRVFIDKPIVGRARDVDALQDLERRTGVPVMAGSVLRYAPAVHEAREGVAAIGPIVSAFASGPHDFFNYGTHAIAMLGGFFGAGITAVTHVGRFGTDLLLLEQGDGPPIVLQLSTPDGWEYSFFLALTTDRTGVEAFKFVCDDPFSDAMTEAQMADFARYARGAAPRFPLADVLEEVSVVLAAAESKRTGRRVALDEIPAGAGFDGASFTRAYAGGGGWTDASGGGSRQPVSTYSVDG
jgi:predicted dehydrogenase